MLMKILYVGESSRKITGNTFLRFEVIGFIFRARFFLNMGSELRFLEKDSGTFS